MRTFSAVLATMLAAAVVIAQNPPPPPTVPPVVPPTTSTVGTQRPVTTAPVAGRLTSRVNGSGAFISGQVTDTTGHAVPQVAVRLISDAATRSVLADVRGRFQFSDIAPGEYLVTAKKKGFFDGAFGKRRSGGDPLPVDLAAGEAIEDMRVELFRGAVLTGTITDEAAEPVVGARVVAMRRTFLYGSWQYVATGADVTDDTGVYRIFGLEPGEYLVSCPTIQAGPLSQGLSPASETVTDSLAYPTLFFPSIRYLPLAMTIPLAASEVRYAVDFRWLPVAAFPVSGRLFGPPAEIADLVVKLIPFDSHEIALGNEAAIALTAPDGSFEFPRVPAGVYRLETISPSEEFWARAQVTVADEAVRELEVTLLRGRTVSGVTLAEAEGKPARVIEGTAVSVSLVPARPGLSGTVQLEVRDDGTFEGRNLIPGEYFLRVGALPEGWTLKSLRGGGRDLLDAPIDLTGSSMLVEIVLTDRQASIRGSVRDVRMQAASGAAVIVMPAERMPWSVNRMRQTRASTRGQFVVAGLPPGEYLAVAIDDAQAEGWQDPRMLEQLRTLGSRLTLREGQDTVVSLLLRTPHR